MVRRRLVISAEDFGALCGGDFGKALLVAVSATLAPHVEAASGIQLLRLPRGSTASRLAEHVRSLGLEGEQFTLIVVSDKEATHLDDRAFGQAKIAFLTSFSSRPSAEQLGRALQVARTTDYGSQLRLARSVLNVLDGAARLALVTPTTLATFEHRRSRHWFSLAGPMAFGHQVVLPTGEISVLRDRAQRYSRFARIHVTGELLLRGGVLVHRGTSLVSRRAALRLQARLLGMVSRGVIVAVRRGVIQLPVAPDESSPKQVMRDFLSEEPRYAIIHEVGFGLNSACAPLRHDNSPADERHPGVHFGVGLGGYTKFHVDFICPDTSVIASDKSRMRLVSLHSFLS